MPIVMRQNLITLWRGRSGSDNGQNRSVTARTVQRGFVKVLGFHRLRKKGYTGSVASLRMFMQKERTRMHEQNETEI